MGRGGTVCSARKGWGGKGSRREEKKERALLKKGTKNIFITKGRRVSQKGREKGTSLHGQEKISFKDIARGEKKSGPMQFGLHKEKKHFLRDGHEKKVSFIAFGMVFPNTT